MHTERIKKVLALAMAANPDLPIPLSVDNMDLDDITPTPSAKRNTQATLYARDTGDVVRYAGNSEIYYDRIDIARYWQKPNLIENPDAQTVKDLVAILRNRYGLDVLDTEVMNVTDALPDNGTVTIVIDDAVSPLYIGKVDVAFAKDAGLSEQDGIAYELGTVPDGIVLAYSDDALILECSINGSRWVAMTRNRNARTSQYEYRSATKDTLAASQVRIRGAVVQLMDNTGAYVPLTYLTLYRGSTDATGYCAGIRSLQGVRANAFEHRADLVSADYLFDGCVNLTDIPEHLFSPCRGLRSAKAVCRNTGITTIPESLFESCGELTHLTSAFEQCRKLQSVPEKLFSTNTALTTLRRCFLGCEGLQQNIATTSLLASLVNLADVSYLFSNCPSISTLPAGLLKNQTQLLSAEGMFAQCRNLQAIPADLFATTSKLNNVSELFVGCVLVNGIPPGLFQAVPNLEYAESTFAGTGILTTPAVMFTYTRRLLSINRIFAECKQLRAIPPTLLQPLMRLQSANGVWRGCSNITAVPAGLLASNGNLLSIVALFAYTGITAVDAQLFQNTTKVTDYSQVFEGTALTTVPAEILRPMEKATRMLRAFYNCQALTSLPSGLLDHSTGMTLAIGAFANCPKLAVSINGLFPATNQLTNLRGLFQNSPLVTGSFAAFKTEYPNVNWTDPNTTQGCIAGCTQLSDYAAAGTIYKTPLAELM